MYDNRRFHNNYVKTNTFIDYFSWVVHHGLLG